jgi:selenocysteine-specific elongation factor
MSSLSAEHFLDASSLLFGREVREEADKMVLRAVERGHAADPLRAAVPLAEVRQALPRWAPSPLADAVLDAAVARGALAYHDGGVRRPDHRPEMTPDQSDASRTLEAIFRDGGLAPPFANELPAPLAERADLRSLLRRLEQTGVVRQVADGFYLLREELEAAALRVTSELGGRKDLGPSDFRDVLPVSRKWLIPLLNYFDGQGVTVRHDGGRDVPAPDR